MVKKNSNFEGNEGTQKKSYYENAISKIIIEIFSKKFNNKLKKMKEETFKCLKDCAHNFICGIKKNIKNVNKIFINEIVSKLNEKIDN